MQVTLTKVFRDSMDTKYGMRAKVAIQTSEHGDKWLSALLQPNKTMGTEDWDVGDSVNIEVTEKGDFLNFKPLGGATGPSLDERVSKLEGAVFGGADTNPAQAPAQEEATIQADDLPDFDTEEDGTGF